ncbi:MAG TPA: RNA polymerase sigma-70 factor [Sphingobacterium sp.]|nr:RNA polymerase sigma-70 factor [Sphingobacterium sp.]
MNSYDTYNDLDLFVLCKAGDETGFRVIYDRYWVVLYRHAYRLLGNEAEAQDAVQEVFVNLWDRIHDLDMETSLKAYLYTAVKNTVLNIFQKEKNKNKFILSLGDFMEHSEAIADHRLRERILQEKIEKEVALLPAKMRKIFELSRMQQLSHKEIAKALNLSDKTVKKQISNAVRLLRLKLSGFILLAFWLTFF